MKHNLLIFLLLIAFNANAMTSTMLMSRLIPSMDMGISELRHSAVEKQSSHHHLEGSHDEMSTYGEPSQIIGGVCDDEINCSACLTHCTSVVILIETTDFSFHNRFSFSAFHSPSEAVSNNFRLLRPPKHT